jgi:hypothetical protein
LQRGEAVCQSSGVSSPPMATTVPSET